jgi:hypothetical protein
MCPPFVTAAISQSNVINNQVQLGDVFATQTLDVQDAVPGGSSSLTTPATGNSFIGSAVGITANVVSTQSLSGDVSGDNTVTAGGYAGDSIALTATGSGNTAESNAAEGALITGSSTQTVGAVNVTAANIYTGPTSSTGGMSVSGQAVANSQGFGADDSEVNHTVDQTSAAVTQADNEVTLQYTAGVVVSSALATSNNVTATGAGTSNIALDVSQSTTAGRTEATNFTYAGNAQDITAQATVTGNNISANNEGGTLDLTSDQDNATDVRAEAYLSSFQFGSGAVAAYGVGNSVMAGNFGFEVIVDNTQNNTGAVDVSATFTGDNGYDAYSSATAIGNAVTGFACSDCSPGRMTVSNSQVNSANIGATGSMTISGSNRSSNTVTSATGNSATFYVSRPQ